MTDTILILLEEDHKKVQNILEKLSETTENAIKTRQKFFLLLKDELTLHTKFEEEIFYPAVKEKADKNDELEDLIMEAYQEHHIVDVLLSEMESLECTDEAWTAKLTVLKENIEHHVKEEENDLFPKAKKILNASELKEMALQLKEWKKVS